MGKGSSPAAEAHIAARLDFHKLYVPAGYFCLRTPMLEMGALEKAIGLADEATSGAWSEALLEKTLQRSRRGLHAFLKTALMQEAIYVASPSFFVAIDDLLLDDEAGLKALRTAYRYVSRACRRATPFGLFATVSVGNLDQNTKVQLAPIDQVKRHARLDFYAICRLVMLQLNDPNELETLRFQPTTSLYEACGRLRYSAADLIEGTTTPLLDLGPSDALREALAASRRGGTRAEIASQVAAKVEVTLEEAVRFVNSLIENQILLPSALPPLTGDDLLGSALERQVAGSKGHSVLRQTARQLDALQKLPLGASRECYEDVRRVFSDAGIEIDANRTVQIDTTRPLVVGTLGTNVADEVLKAARVMHASRADGVLDADLAEFRRRYDERFEGRELPLARVLDEELGIGFGSTKRLEDELIGRDADSQESLDSLFATYLTKKLLRALDNGDAEIAIDFDEIPSTRERVPSDAFSAWFHLLAHDAAAIDEGRFRILLRALIAPSGTQFFARFCGADPALRGAVEAQLRAESALRPDAILADVVHLPQGRTANIMLRPTLRPFEIVYLAGSGAPLEHQIDLSDLMVSVRGDRVTLRSAKHNREVLIRITNGHNIARTAGFSVYRFLSAVQSQDRSVGSWTWGQLAGAPFLPRVVTGRTILAPAQWRFDPRELKAIFGSSGAKTFANLRALRDSRHLPRRVIVAEIDNWLFFDLDHPTGADSFVATLRRAADPLVLEDLTEAAFVESPDGRHTSEMIVPFVRRHLQHRSNESASSSIIAPRRFPPGSEVLSLALSTDDVAAASILGEIVAPIARRAVDAGIAKRWFFLRGSALEAHLDIHLVGEASRLHTRTLPELLNALAPWLDSERLWKIETRTYERKLELFGGEPQTVLAEELSYADSEACLFALEAMSDGEPFDSWVLAMACVHRMLNVIDATAEDRLRVIEHLGEARRRELHASASFVHGHGKMFRARRAELGGLASGPITEGPYAHALTIYEQRLSAIPSSLLEQLRRSIADAASQTRLDIIAEHTQGTCGRIFASPVRAQELLAYQTLAKIYDGALARARKSGAGA